MFKAALVTAALGVLPRVLGHGGVLYYSNAGNWYNGWRPYNSPTGQSTIQRPWATYDPIQDPSLSTIACNDDGTSPDGQLTATVAAGSAITAYWNVPWPHPYGPQLTYLAQCPGSTCTGVDATTLKWFKIDEAGLLSGTVGNGYWGAGKMIDQNNSWTTTIPSSVPSGNYLIRFETIALHSQPAQLYPECAQIQITGGGSRAPTAAELVSFPGAYKASDPGLAIDLYSQASLVQSTYVIPGPPLYGGSSSSPASSAAPASSSVRPTTSAAPVTTSRVATTSAAGPTTTSTGTVALYGQCGGIGYSGPTTCVAGATCTVLNDYYSQCTVARLVVFGTTLVSSVIVMGLSAHIYSNIIEEYEGSLVCTLVAFATAAVTWVLLPPMLVIDFLRKGAFTSMIVYELGVSALLWVLHLVTAMLAIEENGKYFYWFCNAPTMPTCSTLPAMIGFTVLPWIFCRSSYLPDETLLYLFLVTVYGITLIAFGLLSGAKRKTWTNSVQFAFIPVRRPSSTSSIVKTEHAHAHAVTHNSGASTAHTSMRVSIFSPYPQPQA
ncbi:hypothetical protein ONZ45_g9304 [Pleurotus djamor]|nr:hypothetical protein ONZ45_g9304 [Pleurotus djamor]